MTIINLNSLVVGEVYNREYLAKLWGYQDLNAIRKGIVTPSGDKKIILFITEEKASNLPQYLDHFDGTSLLMDGENGHTSDRRLMNSAESNDDIHLFFRKKARQFFTYYGLVKLISYTEKKVGPSKFVFSTNRFEVDGLSSLWTEVRAHGGYDYTGVTEGLQKVRDHFVFERSAINRARAIEIHGTICHGCGFNFNEFYGQELARDYIEIHHIKSLADGVQLVNPETDLVPLCSNCHSMVHRRRDQVLSITELKKLVKKS